MKREQVVAELKAMLDDIYGLPGFTPHADTIARMERATDRLLALITPSAGRDCIIVPREATDAMIQAACDATFGKMLSPEEAHRAGYAAMLAAVSPEPAHTDHPLRHFDRTCQACIAASNVAPVKMCEHFPKCGCNDGTFIPDECWPQSAPPSSEITLEPDYKQMYLQLSAQHVREVEKLEHELAEERTRGRREGFEAGLAAQCAAPSATRERKDV